MMSQTGLAAYFWGVYVWYVLGFLAVAIPAIMEIAGMLRGNAVKQVNMHKESAR